MKKTTNSLSTKVILMVAAVLLLSNSVLGIISITGTRISIRKAIQQRMLDIANCAAGSVNGDVLHYMTQADVGSEAYQEVYRSLAIFRDNVELEYVYALRQEQDGTFIFLLDTDKNKPASFGDEAKLTQALSQAGRGIASVDEVPYSDAWGEFYSAYCPVFDSQGEIAAIVTADFSAQWFDSQLSQQTRSTIITHVLVLLLTLMMAIVLSLVTVRPFVKRQEQLSAEVERQSEANRQILLEVVQSLAAAIDAKDHYTRGHSRRVAEYAREIARRYGLDSQKLEEVYMMGLLHDVGKIGVPDEVINKPSSLTPEEFDIIKQHPIMGERILRNIKGQPKLYECARWHHERYGGGGYPDNLSHEDIPVEERIIAVADAYDAMTSNRSYRKAMAQSEVRQQIVEGRGTQFDPVFADIMLGIIDEDKYYRLRENPENA